MNIKRFEGRKNKKKEIFKHSNIQKKISCFFLKKKKKSNFHWALSRVDNCENSVLLTLERAATRISNTLQSSTRRVEGTEKLL
jgi:hypothetical protein